MTHADALMNAVFSALDRIDDMSARWFADEVGYERCTFLRDEDGWIVVQWCDHEYLMDPRRVFCNPTDARIEHEILRDKAESRVYEQEMQ